MGIWSAKTFYNETQQSVSWPGVTPQKKVSSRQCACVDNVTMTNND